MELYLRLSGDKSTLSGGKIQVGPPPANLPPFAKESLGCKNRSKRRLLSSPRKRGPQALSSPQSGRSGVVPDCPGWAIRFFKI